MEEITAENRVGIPPELATVQCQDRGVSPLSRADTRRLAGPRKAAIARIDQVPAAQRKARV